MPSQELDIGFVLVRDVSRQINKPRTSRQFNQLMNKSWEKKSTRLPNFTARELAADYRGAFTRSDTVTAMDAHLAKHMHFERKRGFRRTVFGWTRRTYNRGIVDTSAAKKALERQMRTEGLSWSERTKVRHAFRHTINRLKAGGAKSKGRKLTLSFQQQRQLYRFDGSPKELSWKSMAILDEAKRQSSPSIPGVRGHMVIYDPKLDARADELADELKALRKSGLAQLNAFGSYTIEEPRLRHWLKEFDRTGYGLLGCERWATRTEKRFSGITDNFETYREGFLYVSLRGDKRPGNSPLQHGLSDSTRKVYLQIARKLDQQPVESRPLYLAGRANQVGTQRWWAEHGVLRRQVRYLEEVARERGNNSLADELFQMRRGIESMQYKSLRTLPTPPKTPKPHHAPVSEEAVEAVRLAAMRKGDVELADALSIAAETGLRPAELDKGVQFERRGNITVAHIQGAKKNQGLDSELDRFAANKGLDRSIQVRNPRLAEVAQRHGMHFRQATSKEALAERLRELRQEVPEASHMTFYTLRHAYADKLRAAGCSPEEVARQMGHQSIKSQESYGTR